MSLRAFCACCSRGDGRECALGGRNDAVLRRFMWGSTYDGRLGLGPRRHGGPQQVGVVWCSSFCCSSDGVKFNAVAAAARAGVRVARAGGVGARGEAMLGDRAHARGALPVHGEDRDCRRVRRLARACNDARRGTSRGVVRHWRRALMRPPRLPQLCSWGAGDGGRLGHGGVHGRHRSLLLLRQGLALATTLDQVRPLDWHTVSRRAPPLPQTSCPASARRRSRSSRTRSSWACRRATGTPRRSCRCGGAGACVAVGRAWRAAAHSALWQRCIEFPASHSRRGGDGHRAMPSQVPPQQVGGYLYTWGSGFAVRAARCSVVWRRVPASVGHAGPLWRALDASTRRRASSGRRASRARTRPRL